ncbi:hypothetical protein VMCG_09077 [Cytospora schulzeri]|uniref:Uncharacterized protein n=1 Tax=Cytospora schulzeri TaxID=448051 RepID=A0A423VP15_9PEZI|nr:hypothetical protein VMCG_09077 [Valsa malicola]
MFEATGGTQKAIVSQSTESIDGKTGVDQTYLYQPGIYQCRLFVYQVDLDIGIEAVYTKAQGFKMYIGNLGVN